MKKMRKVIIVILVVLLAAMAVAVPALADSSEACDGLDNALSHVGKGNPAGPVLVDQMKHHSCGGGEQQ